MGNQIGRPGSHINGSHIELYKKILQIQDPQTRVRMLRTCISGPEYIQSAKTAGIYSHILEYIRAITYDEPGMHILPGEKRAPTAQRQMIGDKRGSLGGSVNTLTIHTGNTHKARDYFQWSLEVLGVLDNDGLTHELIKAAYKRAATKAHPDKGGSDKAFKDVTKAYAYLTDILNKITGRKVTTGTVTAESEIAQRREDNDRWSNLAPVKLDPKNLNMSAFNDLFEKTRIPDPDEDGYGDWLKSDAATEAPKFSGEFNRDVFMRTFEDSLRSKTSNQQQIILNPNAMALVAPVGTELGRDRPADYTAPFMSDMNYTDLRSAYTEHNTIMNHVANVSYEERSFDKYKSSYDAGPGTVSEAEMDMIRRSDNEMQERERQRQIRHAQQDKAQMDNADKLRQFMLTNNPQMFSKK
jgi:curved DNA-binding protein CbpA